MEALAAPERSDLLYHCCMLSRRVENGCMNRERGTQVDGRRDKNLVAEASSVVSDI